jgi:hypothetical protein
MTFEEFFKKKKIDIGVLATAEPVLFAEFEAHYAVMGEKSFDHTKKFRFNELRRKYHTSEEVKPEKVQIENQIAEQTVIDSVTNEVPAVPEPKLGFKPKFRAGVTAAADKPVAPEAKAEETAEATAPKLGFKPKFKAGVTKPAESTLAPAEETKAEAPVEEHAEAPAPKLGFKPKFKAGATKPTESTNARAEEAKTEETAAVEETKVAEAPKNEELADVPVAPKLGFKPKFKAGVTKPKTNEE